VQELICYWSGGYASPEEQRIDIELGFDPEGWFAKQGLVFVRVDRGAFMPLHGDLPARFILEQAEHFVWRFESFRRMVEEGAPLSSAYLTLPIQRVFHRSKIGAFQTATLEQLRERLGGA
jgi:hypothetical protein